MPTIDAAAIGRTDTRMRMMMRTRWVLIGSCLIAMCGYAAGVRTVDIELAGGKVAGKNSVRVTQGDSVQLRWKSDVPLELHLHGYDLTTRVSPGMPGEMKFTAHATGRFPVEIHGERKSSGGHGHKPVFYLEVYPD